MRTVGDLMSTDLFTLKLTDTLLAARSLMSLARIRHIPIVDDANRFLGLVTHRDLLEATLSKFAEVDHTVQEEIDSGIPITEIMRSDVLTTNPGTPLREAAKTLLMHKYGCLPVVDKGILLGIITEADFLRLALRLLDPVESA